MPGQEIGSESNNQPEEGSSVQPRPSSGPTSTQKVRRYMQVNPRRDQPTNYRKHTLFALVAAFAIHTVANLNAISKTFWGKP